MSKKVTRTKKPPASRTSRRARRQPAKSTKNSTAPSHSTIRIGDEREKDLFWDHFIRSLDAEPRPNRVIHGASGVEHRLLGLGVDDVGKRLVLVSDAPEARSAAMMQVDVQTTVPDTRVVVARPIATDFTIFVRSLVAMMGASRFPIDEISQIVEQLGGDKKDDAIGELDKYFGQHFRSVVDLFKFAPLDLLYQIQQLFGQLSLIDWGIMIGKIFDKETRTVDIEALTSLDIMGLDRKFGVCPVPLFDFNENDLEAIRSGSRFEEITEIIRRLQIYQYFFPSPDHLVLGLIDRGVNQKKDIVQHVKSSPEIGHPFGPVEIVAESTDPLTLIDALQDRGMCVSGKHTMEMTEDGQAVRHEVEYKPRESILSKIINRVQVKIGTSGD